MIETYKSKAAVSRDGKGRFEMECQKCGKETFLPFKCPYCGGCFCAEHRLPENHDCPRLEFARVPLREERPVPMQLQTSQIQSPYEYTVTYIPVGQKRRLHFSSKEIKHLAVAALLVLSIGMSLGISPRFYVDFGSPVALFFFALAAAASFLAHELAHKITAQKEGLWAEFRLMFMGLILTALSIISPTFKIISPGAVVIFGFADRKRVGKISIAGPTTNLALSAGLALAYFGFRQRILAYVAAFNAWISLFNLIPFGILDGYKIFTWKKGLWALTFMLSLVLTVIIFQYL